MYTYPLITIAIPTLNQARYIEQALDSLVLQSYPRLRIVVLDGGSTDGTLDILRKYERHFFYWRSAEDKGPWSAIMEAVGHAEDGWFNWLNSDDFLLPGSLELLAKLIRLFPDKKWISGARLDVDDRGLPMRSTCPWLFDPTQIAFSQPFLPQDSTFFQVPFAKTIINKIPPDFQLVFDTVLHRLAWRAEKPLLTNAVFSAMRWHGDQLTSAANQIRRDREYRRFESLFGPVDLTWCQRLLRRACNTRFHSEFVSLVGALMARGCFDSRQQQACLYWPWNLEMKSCSVAEAYTRYR